MMNETTFLNKKITTDGSRRAFVEMRDLETLWFNTGTLCNLKCSGCYIESSPINDHLEYIKFYDVKKYINEIISYNYKTKVIGFTGGEPFMNPDIIKILNYALKHKFNALVLSNGLRPIEIKFKDLLNLPFKENLIIRISIDHHKKEKHEKIRGSNTWEKLLKNIQWLYKQKFIINIASRLEENDSEEEIRDGFQKLFNDLKIKFNAYDRNKLILFPHINSKKNTLEITENCWKILNKKPQDLMCSSSRMVVKKKSDLNTKILACTLVTKHKDFELGKNLKSADKKVYLNHPFCSQFCVLGNSSCS